MSNPNQLKSKPKDTRYWDTHAAYLQTYRSLLRKGIYFFDDDGKISGRNGKRLLEKMLAHFEKDNDHRRSAYLGELLTDYKIIFRKFIEDPNYQPPVPNFSETEESSPKSPEDKEWETQESYLTLFYIAKYLGMEIFSENGPWGGKKHGEVLKTLDNIIAYYEVMDKQPTKAIILHKLLSDYKKKFSDSNKSEVAGVSNLSDLTPTEGNQDK